MSTETETKMDGTIESAVSSIIAPEETIEETIKEEIQETEEVEASAESDVVDEVESEDISEDEEEEISAESDEDNDDQVEDASSIEPEMYSVKVDGQNTEVTLEDLKQGYSGQKYVQKGMQETADMKKEVATVYDALKNERQVIANLYQQIQEKGFATQPEKPSKELFEADPIGYMKKNIDYEAEMVAYNDQMAQLQHVTQQNSAAQENAQQAYMREQMQILQKEIPEFADEKKGQQLKDQLVNTGTNHYGYTTDEISQITDARAIKVLRDATLYQDIIAGKTKAKVKTQSATPVIKPGAKKVATPNAKIRSRQKAKLKGSGSIEDAMNLILNT